MFDPAMVVDALCNIADHFCVEKTDRQFHQFDKEVGDDGDIDTAVHVQQYPAPDHFDSSSTCKQNHLRCQHQLNKTNVLPVYAVINHALGKKWKYQRQEAAQQHSQHQLENKFF